MSTFHQDGTPGGLPDEVFEPECVCGGFGCDECCGPPNCPGGGVDDLCTWPDVEGCGLCTLGKNPAVYGG